MKRIAVLYAVIVLGAGATAWAQLAGTKLYNLVDVPATVTYSQSGQAQIQLDPQAGSTISTAGYHKVYVRVGTTKAKHIMINMGKISGPTLSQMFTRPVGQSIQAFDVVGPEMVLWLTGGPANKTEKVQLWVFLTS